MERSGNRLFASSFAFLFLSSKDDEKKQRENSLNWNAKDMRHITID